MKGRQRLWLLLWLASACAAEAGTPTIDDATPQEAAQTVTDLACDKAAECGYIVASCTACEVGVPNCESECTVEHQEYSAAECVDDVHEDLVRGFGCEDLTADEVERVNDCLAAIPDAGCPRVEDVEAWVEGGRQGRDPRDPVEACDLLFDDIIYRCASGE